MLGMANRGRKSDAAKPFAVIGRVSAEWKEGMSFFLPGGLLSMCSSRSACMGPGSPHISGPHEQAAGSIFWQVSMPPSRMPVPLRTGQALDKEI